MMKKIQWAGRLAGILILTVRLGGDAGDGAASMGRAPGVGDILKRNILAAGGTANLARMRNFSFRVGFLDHYTASDDGRLLLRRYSDESVIFETLAVAAGHVRQNQLGHEIELGGVECSRWLCMARLCSGLFSLKNFSGPFSYRGGKSFGQENFYVLDTRFAGLQVSFHIDAADYLVKRMILRGRDAEGQSWELSCEFAGFSVQEGIMLPARMFASQVGVSGTYSPYVRGIDQWRFNQVLPADFEKLAAVKAGHAIATPGRLSGNVLLTSFDDDDLFVQIYSNWSEADIRAAGFGNDDLLVIGVGGEEFETRFYFTEDQVQAAAGVYNPGRSLFTHNPMVLPMFYTQFNTCSPRQRYLHLKEVCRIMAPISARKKS